MKRISSYRIINKVTKKKFHSQHTGYQMSSKDKNKVIILGLAESGKSTIVKSFTEGHKSSQEGTYSATINYERKKYSFLGKELTVFDLGGQQSFIDRFTGSLAEFIFSEVRAFVFIIDVSKFEEISRAKYYLDLSVKNLAKYSPNSSRYIFIHKIDLLKKDFIKDIELRFKEFLLDGIQLNFKVYTTSVYQDTIYTALGDVFSNISTINKSIDPIITDFISKLKDKIVFGGLVARNGTPLSSSNLFPKLTDIPFSSTILLSEEYIQHVFKNQESKISLINIELDNSITFIKYLKNDIVLIIGFKKGPDDNLSNLFPKVQIFTSMLENAIKEEND
jgi:GTPase SAR1 family protein